MTQKNRIEFTATLKTTLFFMLFAYAFSFAIRMIWIMQFSSQDEFYWNDQLMINTNDGYLWASSALNEMNQQFQNNPRIMSMYSYGTVFVTFIAAKILPFSIETIILYMPSVIASLVVVPIILIGRLYNQTLMGFLAALLGSIAWSYYNRTMAGYYDTDMFSAMAPMFILYFLLRSIEHENLNNLLYASLAIILFPFLYDSGLSIVYAMGIIAILYMLVFHRKEAITYQSIIILSIALIPFVWFIKTAMVFSIYVVFKRELLTITKLQIIALLSFIAFLFFGNVIALVWAKFAVYAFRGFEDEGLKFYQVAQTVREAGKIPFEVMANRISGSTLGVLAALAGYILLVIKHRTFILALPLIGIGIFSLWGGLRFTVYAVPVAAISAIYLFVYLSQYLRSKVAQYTFIIGLTALIIYPNITHIIGYKVPTVLSKSEVQVLDNLGHIGSNKDYIIAWWDYGYPLWFYTQKNTLIDGGKHNHDNYLVSKILTSTSPLEAARLSRIAVETYVDSNYAIISDTLFNNKQENQLNVDDYMEQLQYGDIALPEKTRDIYLYLPLRMLDILPTVKVFSNIDLETGKAKSRPFFYKSDYIQQQGSILDLGRGIKLNQQKGTLLIGQQELPIRQFITTKYQNSDLLQKSVRQLNFAAEFNIIYMQDYRTMLILDNEMLQSLYVQMFVLENYDKNLFEVVELTPSTKVFKVKL